MCDAIILYAEHLRRYVSPRFQGKTFVANNTLCFEPTASPAKHKEEVLAQYGIRTKKNIVCVGRLQRRKRLEHLLAVHAFMKRPDVGLILVGPDPDGILHRVAGENIYKLGPIYDAKKLELMAAADVYCLPGAVGLSIVDAFHCGLPLVTEAGDESAEMMYLKDGENGFIVPRGDVARMAERLLLLLDNAEVRARFAAAAKREISQNGHIDNLCGGFKNALQYVTGQRIGDVQVASSPCLRSQSRSFRY
jgi:phosphatidyl-myo-inositol dimannoside synthase